MSTQTEFTDNSKVMSRSCSHHAAPSTENLDINGNDKLHGVMEDEDLEPETDGYVGDSEMGEETDDVHVDVTPSTPVPNETLTPSDVQHHQRPEERVRPPSRADSTFLTKTKQEPSRENTQVLGSRSNRSDIPEAVSRGLHRSDNTRVLSSRSSNSLRPSSRAVSSTIAPSVGSRKMVSRASRKSRPHSSGSHGDRGQSSGSESETERRTDATSVSEIEFGGVDISDEKAWDTDLEMEESREVYDHTGRSAYIECCKRLGVIPASYFLRHMTDSHLDMKHHGLGVPGVKAVAVALVSNPHVTRLNLQDNWLGTEGGVAVCDMLRENCFISDLNLSDNKLGLDFVPMITDVVLNAGNLTHLTLSGNNFDDSTGASFAELIMNTRQLEYLNLSSNKLGEEAGAALGAAISENSSLKHLDLSWNCLRRKGAVCVAMGVKTNVFMKQLNLSWNGFGVEGALALGDALKGNSVLQELDITNNRITAEGAVWIGKGLALNETLKTLKMATNPMESPGCFAILASVLRNPSSVVEFLDFNDIQVNRDFHEILQQCQAAFPQLKVIHGGSELLKKPKIKLHPMIKLRNYIEKHNLRMIDFFNKFDKDGSLNVSREEFVMGLEDTGIQLNEEEVEILVSEMDKDGDGEINYSELVIGQRDFMEREERLQKASVASY